MHPAGCSGPAQTGKGNYQRGGASARLPMTPAVHTLAALTTPTRAGLAVMPG
jgi:hypothetical protein